ncbi:MAG: hypothetical protein ACUVSV_15525, partial [Armatimonadota bacterium]
LPGKPFVVIIQHEEKACQGGNHPSNSPKVGELDCIHFLIADQRVFTCPLFQSAEREFLDHHCK